MPIRPQPPTPEQPNPYLSPGPEPLMFEQFQGIDTTTTRPGVADEKMWWSDGFFPLAPRNLRTLPGVGPRLWHVSQSSEPAGTTIVFYDFANIGANPIAIVILSNGSIYQVNTSTGVGTRIAVAGTITNPSRLTTGMTQWGNQYVIIVAVQTNGYFIWDGTTFYTPGGAAPQGGTMPIGLGGSAVEVYTGRVWVATGSIMTFSAPGSVSVFSSASGGGQFQSSDSFLRVNFTQLKQSNGFLYLIGDSSINYISGVQTSGSPPTTTFTNQNADPEVGTPWPGTVNTFGRNIMLANAFGVHVSYGAAVTKVSEPLDGVYSSVSDFAGFIPSAAKAIIYGKKTWMLLLPIIDPFTAAQVNKLLMWNGKIWFASTQDITLAFIQTQEIASILTAWGTDGSGIWPLFQTPSTALTKVVQSRLWDKPIGYEMIKTSTRLLGLVQFYNFTTIVLTVSIDSEKDSEEYTVDTTTPIMTWTNNTGATMTWTNNALVTMTWLSASSVISVFNPTAVAQTGVLTGLTLQTNCADMALISMMLQDEIAALRM